VPQGEQPFAPRGPWGWIISWLGFLRCRTAHCVVPSTSRALIAVLRGGRFKGGEALAGTRGNKDEFPSVTAWQNVKLFHCLALFLKGFEQIRKGPFRAGDKVKMYASPGVLVPAGACRSPRRRWPADDVRGGDQELPGQRRGRPHGDPRRQQRRQGARLRYARPDLSRNEQWVEFVCTTCVFHGGSREVGKNVCLCACARALALCACVP
jgi:hypothetical protein